MSPLILLTKFIVLTLIALVSPQIFPGIRVRGASAAAAVALVFGLLNLVVGWLITVVLTVVTLPLTCLTFGLFWLLIPTVVNALLLKVTDELLEPFELRGWLPAFVMGFLFAVALAVVNRLG